MVFKKGNQLYKLRKKTIGFSKGYTPWNKGLTKKSSKKIENQSKNISLGLKRAYQENRRKRGLSEKTKNKIKNTIREQYKNGKVSPTLNIKVQQKIRKTVLNHYLNNTNYGFRNVQNRAIGERHPNWKGGIAINPYPKKFNKELKNKIKIRDGYRCQECFRHQDELKNSLVIHHIDFNKQNCDDNNLITLCYSCHGKTQYNSENWIDYYKEKILEQHGGVVKWEDMSVTKVN